MIIIKVANVYLVLRTFFCNFRSQFIGHICNLEGNLLLIFWIITYIVN